MRNRARISLSSDQEFVRRSVAMISEFQKQKKSPIAHAVDSWVFTVKDRIHSHGNSYGICGTQSDSGTRISHKLSFQQCSTFTLHHDGTDTRPSRGRTSPTWYLSSQPNKKRKKFKYAKHRFLSW